MLTDGDPATAWRIEAVEASGEAWAVLHLGKLRPVRSIGWQVGPEGLAGSLVVEASKDGKRWRVLGEVAAAAPGAWQTLRLRDVIEARQVRLRFVGGEGVTHARRAGRGRGAGAGRQGCKQRPRRSQQGQVQGRWETRPGQPTAATGAAAAWPEMNAGHQVS